MFGRIWVGPADSVVVLKRGLQESQIEEAREAVKKNRHDEAVGRRQVD